MIILPRTYATVPFYAILKDWGYDQINIQIK